MGPKLDFYEVVSILPCNAVPKHLWGTQGVVLGRTENENMLWEYAVQVFEDGNLCWQLEEKYLQSEGRKMTRDEIFTGETVKVYVDPATGEGSTDK